ncbi:MAG: NAD(+)/NADH kinase [Spirochaetaceae bacterium]|jgi:NAD+ kinase|nr:NAD(+)/NADH kinase [Spirochaetaceae bacterium]
MAHSNRVLLFVNKKKSQAAGLVEEIIRVLSARAYTVDSFSGDAETRAGAPKDYAIAFSLGGDGTVLYAARIAAPLAIPLIPVNLGTLGFIAAVLPTQWGETFKRWEAGNAVVSRRIMLEVSVERGGETVFQSACLNDAVISAAGIAKLIRLEVEAETSRGDHIVLGHFRADGLIVSTPTGSTGYSVAAGGPILDPEMEGVIINPICPFTLSNRPMVVPADDRVCTLVEREQRSSVLLTVDGQITEPLQPEDRIIIRRAPYAVRLIASDRWAFYRALRTKLAWSGGSAQASYQGGSDA